MTCTEAILVTAFVAAAVTCGALLTAFFIITSRMERDIEELELGRRGNR